MHYASSADLTHPPVRQPLYGKIVTGSVLVFTRVDGACHLRDAVTSCLDNLKNVPKMAKNIIKWPNIALKWSKMAKNSLKWY